MQIAAAVDADDDTEVEQAGKRQRVEDLTRLNSKQKGLMSTMEL